MENLEAQKLIVTMQKDLLKSGIDADKLIDGLKKLRPYAIEDENPTLTKVIRLTYEHIEAHGTFNIPIPEEEPVEEMVGEDGEEVEKPVPASIEGNAEAQLESLNYLLSIMTDARNKTNAADLIDYRDMLMAY